MPDKDVPLADVLEFRLKRKDELLALRHHIEDIYERIISAGDGDLALNRELERLQAAMTDYIKASRGRFELSWSSFDASLNLMELVPPAAVAATGLMLGLPMLEGIVPTTAAAVLSVKFGPSLKWKSPGPTPYKYVTSYRKELF